MKKMMALCVAGMLALVWTLAVTSGTAEAAGKAKKKNGPEAQFKQLDTNNDGKLSKDELSKVGELGKKKKTLKAKKVDKLFSALDTNNDGSISLDEFKKLAEVRKKKAK